MAKSQDQEYRAAFNGETDEPDNQPTVDAPEGEAGPAEPAAAVVIDAPEEGEAPAAEAAEPAAEEVAETPAAEAAEAPAPDAPAELFAQEGEAAEPEMSPEDIQREKSWEGRLKKREEELAAREAALADAPAPTALPEDVAEIVARLSEDFGPEFITAIRAIAAAEAKSVASTSGAGNVEELTHTVNGLIEELRGAFTDMHHEAITDEFPDVEEIAASPEFQAFCEQHAEPERCKQVLENGSARQIVRLLKEFRAHLDAQGSEEHPDADAAEGVKSTAPVSLPTRAPASDDDEYRSAWGQM